MSLEWEKQSDDGEYAFSGKLCVGMIGQRNASPSRWWWQINAVTRVKRYKLNGETSSRASAKRSANQAWSRWLRLASLTAIRSAHGQPWGSR